MTPAPSAKSGEMAKDTAVVLKSALKSSSSDSGATTNLKEVIIDENKNAIKEIPPRKIDGMSDDDRTPDSKPSTVTPADTEEKPVVSSAQLDSASESNADAIDSVGEDTASRLVGNNVNSSPVRDDVVKDAIDPSTSTPVLSEADMEADMDMDEEDKQQQVESSNSDVGATSAPSTDDKPKTTVASKKPAKVTPKRKRTTKATTKKNQSGKGKGKAEDADSNGDGSTDKPVELDEEGNEVKKVDAEAEGGADGSAATSSAKSPVKSTPAKKSKKTRASASKSAQKAQPKAEVREMTDADKARVQELGELMVELATRLRQDEVAHADLQDHHYEVEEAMGELRSIGSSKEREPANTEEKDIGDKEGPEKGVDTAVAAAMPLTPRGPCAGGHSACAGEGYPGQR